MLKKLLTALLALTMMFGITACTSDDSSEEETPTTNTDTTDDTPTERPFTESAGLIKYFKINEENICLPETVGEYVKYLEKIGTRVELGDTGKTVDEAGKLNAGGISSMVAYLKVYLDDDNWQWFGIRYKNDTDKKLAIADCKVTQITLDYDTISEEANHFGIKTIVFVTRDDDEIPMDGKFNSGKIAKLIGNPPQNTDGHWHYQDTGYEYEMVTENQKGILTRVAITYPVTE